MTTNAQSKVSIESIRFALAQTANLIGIGSGIRLAAIGSNRGYTQCLPIVTDSSQCSGLGKVVHGILLGTPDDARHRAQDKEWDGHSWR